MYVHTHVHMKRSLKISYLFIADIIFFVIQNVFAVCGKKLKLKKCLHFYRFPFLLYFFVAGMHNAYSHFFNILRFLFFKFSLIFYFWKYIFFNCFLLFILLTCITFMALLFWLRLLLLFLYFLVIFLQSFFVFIFCLRFVHTYIHVRIKFEIFYFRTFLPICGKMCAPAALEHTHYVAMIYVCMCICICKCLRANAAGALVCTYQAPRAAQSNALLPNWSHIHVHIAIYINASKYIHT